MNISKAIEINTDLMTDHPQVDPELRREAVMLGIEALKRVKACRERTDIYPKYLLPGETEAKPLHALGFNTGDDESP